MVAGVKIRSRADVLALSKVALGDGIGRVPELELLLAVPDKFARGIDRRACFSTIFATRLRPS
jgi:hypothetical protein